MNVTALKITSISAFLSLISMPAFAELGPGGGPPPVLVSEPGTLMLVGIGVAAVLYFAKKRNKQR